MVLTKKNIHARTIPGERSQEQKKPTGIPGERSLIQQPTPVKTPDPIERAVPEQDKYKPRFNRDKSGKINGVELQGQGNYPNISAGEAMRLADAYMKKRTAPPGTRFADTPAPVPLTQQEQIAADYALAQERKAYATSQETPKATAEQLATVGQLTPEQQATANSNAELSGTPNLSQILNIAGEKAAIGAASAATVGAAGGSVIPGLGTLAGAGLGALGGAITGATYGTFAAYKTKDINNVKTVEQNYNIARYNINQAITTANKGGDPTVAIEQYNDALAQLVLAERQMKILSQDPHEYLTNAKDKQTKIESYVTQTLPSMTQRFKLALMKPNPNYFDNGIDENGNPINPMDGGVNG